MLVLTSVIAGIIVYKKLSTVEGINKDMLLVILLMPALMAYLIAVSVVPSPSYFNKVHTDLLQRQSFINELPSIQTVNGKIKPSDITITENIMKKKNKFKKDVENYNNTVKFWKHNQYLDIVLWGFPRWGLKLSNMPLIEVNY